MVILLTGSFGDAVPKPSFPSPVLGLGCAANDA